MRLPRILKVLGALLAAALFLAVLVAAPPAYAGGNLGGGGSVGGGTGSGGGTGGGGGTVTVPPNPPGVTIGSTAFTAADCTPGVGCAVPSITCAKTSDGRMPLGYSWRSVVEIVSPTEVRVVGTTSTGCYWGPKPSTRLVKCPWMGRVVADGPFLNGDGIRSRNGFYNSTFNAPFRAAQTISNCNTPLSFYGAVHVDVYGQYRLTATGWAVPCTLSHYPAGNQPDSLACSSTPQQVTQVVDKLSLFCSAPGWAKSWVSGHSFSVQECATGASGQYSCGAPPTATWTAPGVPPVRVRGPVQAFHSGQTYRLTYALPAVSGVRGARISAGLLAAPTGTPTLNQGAARGQYKTTALSPSSWGVQFWQAGNPGADWTTHPTWRVDGEFPIRSLIVTGISMSSGALTTQTSTSWQPLHMTCSGAAVQVGVYRARMNN